MRIVDIVEFTTLEGSNKTTLIPVTPGPGEYFSIKTDTFETAIFRPGGVNAVPVRMYHNDRNPANVSVTMDDSNTVQLHQVYQQSERGLLYVYVPDDWTPTGEVKPVYVDAMSIDKCLLTNGQVVTVYADGSGAGVKLITTDKAAVSKYVKGFITVSGYTYYYDGTFSANGEANYFLTVPSVISCYKA